jgi:hypothetical protein
MWLHRWPSAGTPSERCFISVTDISSGHEKIRFCTASNKLWLSDRQWAVIEL